MITDETKAVVNKIRRGEIDINNTSSFFGVLIKGMINSLNGEVLIRKESVPHFILHTGDDLMYLMNKGQDMSVEPREVSNEDYIYNQIPRCIVTPGSIDLVPDQLTSPYAYGNLQYEDEDSVYSLAAEFRRMPIKMNFDLKYYTNSYSDSLELFQQIMSKLVFVRTFFITYMGQTIMCSYKIPESYEEEHMVDIDGTTTDSKYRTTSLSIEVETNMPVYAAQTVVSTDSIINLTRSKDEEGNELPKNLGKIDDLKDDRKYNDVKKYSND